MTVSSSFLASCEQIYTPQNLLFLSPKNATTNIEHIDNLAMAKEAMYN